jgi:hypothetical protein
MAVVQDAREPSRSASARSESCSARCENALMVFNCGALPCRLETCARAGGATRARGQMACRGCGGRLRCASAYMKRARQLCEQNEPQSKHIMMSLPGSSEASQNEHVRMSGLLRPRLCSMSGSCRCAPGRKCGSSCALIAPNFPVVGRRTVTGKRRLKRSLLCSPVGPRVFDFRLIAAPPVETARSESASPAAPGLDITIGERCVAELAQVLAKAPICPPSSHTCHQISI